MLVGGVVVEDDVDHLAGRHLGLDRVQEAHELLMAVALHVAADDGPVEDVERSEQGSWCHGACSRASWCRAGPSSAAGPAGCDREPGFCSSRRAKAPMPGAGGPHKAPPR